jgi:hypothetical protein
LPAERLRLTQSTYVLGSNAPIDSKVELSSSDPSERPACVEEVLMSLSNNAIPASLRRPLASSRSAQGLSMFGPKPFLVAKTEAYGESLGKSRFMRMPQESEDAKITGATRSLERRLLALNVGGSLTHLKLTNRMGVGRSRLAATPTA